MYATTGIATDSARRSRANGWARWLAIPCHKLFKARPMPELKIPPSIIPNLQPAAAAATSGGSATFNVLR
jgi:hypothetical protein